VSVLGWMAMVMSAGMYPECYMTYLVVLSSGGG